MRYCKMWYDVSILVTSSFILYNNMISDNVHLVSQLRTYGRTDEYSNLSFSFYLDNINCASEIRETNLRNKLCKIDVNCFTNWLNCTSEKVKMIHCSFCIYTKSPMLRKYYHGNQDIYSVISSKISTRKGTKKVTLSQNT